MSTYLLLLLLLGIEGMSLEGNSIVLVRDFLLSLLLGTISLSNADDVDGERKHENEARDICVVVMMTGPCPCKIICVAYDVNEHSH